jgi:1-acyl-sn-glycerol-3-phosphate acyltransferase
VRPEESEFVRDEEMIARLAAWVERILFPYHRFSLEGLENIPDGPALLVGNHSGGMLSIDSFLFGAAVVRKSGFDKLPWGLAHDAVVTAPGLKQIMQVMGGVRASHENASAAFATGKKLLVYPGGDVDVMRSWKDRNRIRFGGRKGFARLAVRHGVPIVPLVSAGAHETMMVVHDFPGLAKMLGLGKLARFNVLPLALSLPWGLTLGPVPPHLPLPSRISMAVMEPIVPERTGDDAANDSDYVAELAERVERVMQERLELLVERDDTGFHPVPRLQRFG